MKCPKCGGVQFPSTKTCRDCGFRLASWSPPPPAVLSVPTALPSPRVPTSLPRGIEEATLFGDVPCPHCGETIRVSYGPANAAVPVLGVAGALILMPFVARYRCERHGSLALFDFPSQAVRVLLFRRILIFLSGVAVLLLAIALLMSIRD